MTGPLLAGLEAGGTKFNCAVAVDPRAPLRTREVATEDPVSTLANVRTFFEEAMAELGPVQGCGIATFGPVDIDDGSPTFGSILQTPKAGWSGFDLRGSLSAILKCPMAIDTDVAGAALAEARLGVGQGCRSLAYVTVGTGIGGAIIQGATKSSMSAHAEMGHIPIRRRSDDKSTVSVCPYHADCVEGLASGPAILARAGAKLSDLPDDDPNLALVADYIAQLCRSIFLISVPDRIVVGGGVLSCGRLLPLIRAEFDRQMNGYSTVFCSAASLIHPPALGGHAGVVGSLLLAEMAHVELRV